MKPFKFLAALVLAALFVSFTATSRADEKKPAKPKPYPLDTCLVCDMKLSMMGKPYSFAYKGQEIKVCDESEKETFDKEPAKYMKKLKTAEAKAKAKDKAKTKE